MSEVLVSVWVPGLPKGQPRPRAFARGGHARVYNPATAEGWKGEIARAVPPPEAPWTGPIRVSLRFLMPRPKGHYGRGGILKPAMSRLPFLGKPDVDNLAKAVLDVLTVQRVWGDDTQVTWLEVSKHYESGGGPGCDIAVFGEEGA